MGPKKNSQNVAAFQRMNYIYQLMKLSSSYEGSIGGVLTSNYGRILISIGKKTVTRMEPEVKRTVCKGCQSLLIPGETATVRLHKKPAGRIVWKCMKCYTLRRFTVSPNYELWIDSEDATTLELMNHSENNVHTK